MEKYNVDFFIDFFSKKNENQFLVGKYGTNEVGCSMGLCQGNLEAHAALYDLGIKYLKFKESVFTAIIDVNNGTHPNYKQPTPKQRILAALHDIKKMQEPPVETPPARIQYVAVPATITENIELVYN